jgi:hypothetical protein
MRTTTSVLTERVKSYQELISEIDTVIKEFDNDPLVDILSGGDLESLAYVTDNADAGISVYKELGCRWSSMHLAAFFNRPFHIQHLYKMGLSASKTAGSADFTPLHVAIRISSADCVSMLLKCGGNVNASAHFPGMNGEYTPLMQAVSQGRDSDLSIQIVIALLKHKASVDVRLNSQTVFHLAASSGSPRTLSLLLDGRSDRVDVLNSLGDTPLHAAAHARSFSCVKILLDLGASVNAENDSGTTPLHAACQAVGPGMDLLKSIPELARISHEIHRGTVEDGHRTIKLLKERGADEDATDHMGQGYTPESYLSVQIKCTYQFNKMTTQSLDLIPPLTSRI